MTTNEIQTLLEVAEACSTRNEPIVESLRFRSEFTPAVCAELCRELLTKYEDAIQSDLARHKAEQRAEAAERRDQRSKEARDGSK